MNAFSLTLLETIAAAAIMALGSLTQSVIGFGMGLIVVPALLLIDPAIVPGPILVCSVILSSLIFLRDKASIDFSGLSLAAIGQIPGSALGVWVLAILPPKPLSIFLGFLVIAAVLISLTKVKIEPIKPILLMAGILSGFMSSVSSIGGPPIALVYQHAKAKRLRGMLAGFFFLGALISLAALFVGGRFGKIELIASLYLMPGVLAGFAISSRVSGKMNQKLLRPAVLLFSAFAAVSVIVKSLT